MCRPASNQKTLISQIPHKIHYVKSPNREFFLVRIFLCLDWIWTRKNSVFGHISRSDHQGKCYHKTRAIKNTRFNFKRYCEEQGYPYLLPPGKSGCNASRYSNKFWIRCRLYTFCITWHNFKNVFWKSPSATIFTFLFWFCLWKCVILSCIILTLWFF